MTDSRPCTCAPDERPYPCQHQYALGLCRKAEIRNLRHERDSWQALSAAADADKRKAEAELAAARALLPRLRQYIERTSEDYDYGYARPANPHDFSPDPGSCSVSC